MYFIVLKKVWNKERCLSQETEKKEGGYLDINFLGLLRLFLLLITSREPVYQSFVVSGREKQKIKKMMMMMIVEMKETG